MKRIVYKTLRVQNFLSIGNDSITVDFQNGINLVTGKNNDNPERVNGCGKSTILEAVYFAIFGKSIREIKKDFIRNNVTKGKGDIELEFDVHTDKDSKSYKIKRQLKPAKVELFCGEEDITRDSINNTNQYICDLVGTNSVIAKSCDFLSLNDNVPFMAKNASEKRKFIEDIFSLEIFGNMLKDLKELIKQNKSDISISQAKKEEIENSLETLKKQKESFEKEQKEKVERLKKRKKEYSEKIEELKKEISKIDIGDSESLLNLEKKIKDGEKKIESSIKKLNDASAENRTLRNVKKEKLQKVENVEEAQCDKCFQNVGKDHKEHLENMAMEYKEEISKIDSKLEKINSKREELHSKMKQLNEKLNKVQKQIQTHREDDYKLKSLNESLKNYQNNLENLDDDLKQDSSKSFDESIRDTGKRIKKEEKRLVLFNEYSDDLETCKFILGDDGVKSFAIGKLLGMLNASIQDYINKLGMTMKCEFDEFFEEKMINDKNQEISYWNLSGGERRTVDLACSWAFKDIKRKVSGVSYNLEFMDEILDSCFDEHGVDLLLDVIKDRISNNDLGVYLISHRSDMRKHVNGEIIQLEKNNGITTRV